MRASVALPSATSAGDAWARVASFAVRRRWWFVGAAIVVQWAFLGWAVDARINHNGWLFADGDDGPWYWTTAWAQTSLHVPYTAIGAGWPYLLTPLAAIFGPNMADGLPAVIALNLLILGPLSVVCMYLVGDRLAGRLFGVWSALVWALLPTSALALYGTSHRTFLIDFFLPTGTGLNVLSDYPSMVCAIVCAYLVLRAVDSGRLEDGALAGIMLGFLVLMKPANGPLPIAAVILLGVTRRFRALIATVVAAIPAAIALSRWKELGHGSIPALSGGGGGAGGAVSHNAHTYLNIDFHKLIVNAHELREVFWSLRMLEFILVAGSIALIARTRWKGAFVVGWFLGFALVKGTAPYAGVYDTSVYRFLLPAWPAWALIVAGVVFLWPGSRRTPLEIAPPRPVSRWVVGAVALVFMLGPLIVIVGDSPAKPGAIVDENYVGAPLPVVDFGVETTRVGPHTVRFTWNSKRTSHAATAYAVFKDATDGCTIIDPSHPLCRFRMTLIGVTLKRTFTDTQAVTPRYYRIGLVKGSDVQVDNPSMLLMSKPVHVDPR
ncbi:MAG TPA: glycosyltransferase family 39 protein [Gaiellaceae bacterium]|jgi:hypothetical protein|nr:glycosyltransferase family 39 protein [Gaiellaceae bacterium]